MRKLMRIALTILFVGVLVVLTIAIFAYHRDVQALSSHMEELAAQAKVYESELQRLRREAETQKLHIYNPEGPGAAVIAFRIDGEETLKRALSYGTTYGFTPAILINTADEAEELLSPLQDAGLEVILYSRGFAEDEAERIRELQQALTEAGCGVTNAYLLRSADDTEENRGVLREAGIQTLFLYDDSVDTGFLPDGTAKLNYSFVNKSGYTPTKRLAALVDSEQGLLFAVDMRETTVTEHQMDEIIGLIGREQASGTIRICSVSEAVQTVKGRVEREQSRLNEFLAAEEERNTRIGELEAAIHEIYSHWDDLT